MNNLHQGFTGDRRLLLPAIAALGVSLSAVAISTGSALWQATRHPSATAQNFLPIPSPTMAFLTRTHQSASLSIFSLPENVRFEVSTAQTPIDPPPPRTPGKGGTT